MLRDIILDIFGNAWPMLVIFSIILSTIRITYLIVKKEKFIFYRELTYLLFVIYILSLFYIVTFQDNNYGMSNLIPFKEIFRYSFNSELFIKNILGNIILYIPLGFFSSIYIDQRKITPCIIITLITSFSIEIVQLIIGRVFDIDDIILNLFGGFLGIEMFIILDKLKGKLPKILNRPWFINLVMIILLVITIIYLTNISSYFVG